MDDSPPARDMRLPVGYSRIVKGVVPAAVNTSTTPTPAALRLSAISRIAFASPN